MHFRGDIGPPSAQRTGLGDLLRSLPALQFSDCMTLSILGTGKHGSERVFCPLCESVMMSFVVC